MSEGSLHPHRDEGEPGLAVGEVVAGEPVSAALPPARGVAGGPAEVGQIEIHQPGELRVPPAHPQDPREPGVGGLGHRELQKHRVGGEAGLEHRLPHRGEEAGPGQAVAHPPIGVSGIELAAGDSGQAEGGGDRGDLGPGKHQAVEPGGNARIEPDTPGEAAIFERETSGPRLGEGMPPFGQGVEPPADRGVQGRPGHRPALEIQGLQKRDRVRGGGAAHLDPTPAQDFVGPGGDGEEERPHHGGDREERRGRAARPPHQKDPLTSIRPSRTSLNPVG